MFTPADDLFHRPRFQEPAWTETNFFCFCIPDESLIGYIYLMFRPNLGVASYQVIICRGHATTPDEFEYWDSQAHVPIPLANLDDIRVGGALRVRVVEPLRKYQIDYHAGGLELHLSCDAISPADPLVPIVSGEGFSQTFANPYAALADSGHLEQSVMMRGEFTLRGKRYAVAHAASRDHSWSARSDAVDRPWIPSNWDNGHFDDGFCFRVMGRFTAPESVACFAGCIVEGGKSYPIAAARGRYERKARQPQRIVYEIRDSRGNDYTFTGEVVASCNYSSLYLNVVSLLGLVRWQYGTRIGYGEYQNAWHVGRPLFPR